MASHKHLTALHFADIPIVDECHHEVEAFTKQHAARTIQRAWLNSQRRVQENYHVARMHALAKLNASAILLQQWWRIVRARKKYGVAVFFWKTGPTARRHADRLPKRLAVATGTIWGSQELALRTLGPKDPKQFWTQVDFYRCVQRVVNPRRLPPLDDVVRFRGRLIPKVEYQRLKTEARKRTLRSMPYRSHTHPEKLEGRYERFPDTSSVKSTSSWNSDPNLNPQSWREAPHDATLKLMRPMVKRRNPM